MKDSYRPYKPLSMHINNIAPRKAAAILHRFSHIPTVSAYTYRGYEHGTVGVVVSHVNATKQSAIVKLAELLDIATSSFIGIGDSHTDFPLLMACGLKLAMGNAVDGLKDIADYVVPPVEEDGAAFAIRKFILHQER